MAIIQPARLEDSIADLDGKEINLMIVSGVIGGGRQKGAAEVYRSHVEREGLVDRIKIEIAAINSRAWETVDAWVSVTPLGVPPALSRPFRGRGNSDQADTPRQQKMALPRRWGAAEWRRGAGAPRAVAAGP